MAGARRRDRAVETLLAHVVRLALQESWTAEGAARQLRLGPDDAVLQRARRRVATALVERPTPIGVRAAATLDAVRTARPAPNAAWAPRDPRWYRPRPPLPTSTAP